MDLLEIDNYQYDDQLPLLDAFLNAKQADFRLFKDRSRSKLS